MVRRCLLYGNTVYSVQQKRKRKMKSRSSDESFFKKVAVRSNFKPISCDLIHIGLI